ncbi:MAG: hypothetical protein LBC40_00410, partial [Dysgonamonadaceae bacterium]|nr:hypothetical protein [Dysgonamonadaceae bacterium]
MRTLIFLVGFFLTSAIFAQSNIRFDETEAENISYARTKCSVVVKLDPDSPNHFYALFSCINQTIHNRYYTKKKKITIADLEELEKKKIILPDGLCIHTSKTRRTEMPYTKGEKNGIFKVYQKEILQSETLYENDKRVQITEYYENGNAKQKILLEGSTLIEQKHYTPDGRDTVFSIKPVEAVHKMPRFPGGEEKMHEYLKANLNYPKT